MRAWLARWWRALIEHALQPTEMRLREHLGTEFADLRGLLHQQARQQSEALSALAGAVAVIAESVAQARQAVTASVTATETALAHALTEESRQGRHVLYGVRDELARQIAAQQASEDPLSRAQAHAWITTLERKVDAVAGTMKPLGRIATVEQSLRDALELLTSLAAADDASRGQIIEAVSRMLGEQFRAQAQKLTALPTVAEQVADMSRRMATLDTRVAHAAAAMTGSPVENGRGPRTFTNDARQ